MMPENVIRIERLKTHISGFYIGEYTVDSDVEAHTHDFVELAYIREGSLLHQCNGIIREIRRGDYFIVDYTVPHKLRFTGTRTTVVNCIFRPDFIDLSLRGCRSFNEVLNNYLINFDERSNFRPHVGEVFEDDGEKIESVLQKVLTEFKGDDTAAVSLIRAYLIEMIIMTMRKLHFGGTLSSNDVDHVRKNVKERYSEDLKLSVLAQDLNISAAHLSRKFAKETGCGFKEYLQRIRIEEACRLLANSQCKVTDIAERVGYSDVKFFNSTFRRYKSTSPSEFRVYNMDNSK
ncbi:MAG: AraC family transcriptional regulator, partial [Saccharofermentanales bacterium]